MIILMNLMDVFGKCRRTGAEDMFIYGSFTAFMKCSSASTRFQNTQAR